MNKEKLIATLQWAGDRLREASTYSGLGAIFGAAFLFMHVSQDNVAPVVHDVMAMGMALGGLISVVLPEGKRS